MTKSAKNALIRLLSRRDYFSFEAKAKLLEKGFPAEDVEQALSDMEKMGYLDDSKRGKVFALQQLARGYGPRAIEYKLRLKGGKMSYPPTIQEQVEAIFSFIKRKKNSLPRQKLFGKLMQRGFDCQAISNYLDGEN